MAQDQAVEQSFHTTVEAAEAFADVLAPMDSDEMTEQPEGEDAGIENDENLEQDVSEVDQDADDEISDDDEDDEESEEDQDDEDESDDEDVDEDEEESEVYELSDDDVIMVDGQETTLKELKESGLRMGDYTQKTQQLAEQRNQFNDWANETSQRLSEQQQQVQALGQMLEQAVIADNQLDLQELAQTDPAAYIQVKEQIEQRQAMLGQVMQYNQQQAQQQQAIQQQQQQETVMQQRDALVNMPEFAHWKDPAQRKAHQEQIKEYLTGIGIPQEMMGITDAKVLSVIDKAMKFDKLQAETPKTRKRREKAPIRSKSKARRSPAQQKQTEIARKHKRLQQTGSTDDAASLLMDYV